MHKTIFLFAATAFLTIGGVCSQAYGQYGYGYGDDCYSSGYGYYGAYGGYGYGYEQTLSTGPGRYINVNGKTINLDYYNRLGFCLKNDCVSRYGQYGYGGYGGCGCHPTYPGTGGGYLSQKEASDKPVVSSPRRSEAPVVRQATYRYKF